MSVTEVYIAIGSALVSGGMALLGVWLTNHNTNQVTKLQQEAERQKHILEQKEALYYKIFASLDMASYENPYLSGIWKEVDASEEEIEILLQLYAPKEVITAYHHAMEATASGLPHPEIVGRMDKLIATIREDLGVKEK